MDEDLGVESKDVEKVREKMQELIKIEDEDNNLRNEVIKIQIKK